MGLTLEPQALPLRMDAGGTVRVGGTRVTLDTLVNFYRQGYTAERLQEAFPTVSLPDVYAAIGYYLRHKAEVEAYMERRRRAGEESLRQLEALVPPKRVTAQELRDRIAAKRQDTSVGDGGVAT